MTTLIGIKSNKAKPGVILASDLSATSTKWEDRGDFAIRKQTTSEEQKIHINKDQDLAVSMCGVYDGDYIEFLEELIEGKIDFRKAIADGYFREFHHLNNSRWGGMLPQTEKMNSLLIATRFGGVPELYSCFPLGKVETRNLTSIGIGSEYVFNYLS